MTPSRLFAAVTRWDEDGDVSHAQDMQIWSLRSSLHCPQLGVCRGFCRDATEVEQRQEEGGGSGFKLYGLVFVLNTGMKHDS